MPARLLGKGEARTALDLCAAPGGKTMQLAAAGFVVTAVDASESRLARLCENLARTRLEAEIQMADVMKWQRSEEPRVGKGGVRTCRSGWSPYLLKKNKNKKKKQAQ